MQLVDNLSLLQLGVTAAQSGDKLAAREFLIQATQGQPEDVTAWLWLATVARDIQETIAALRQALELDPQQEDARTGLKKLLLKSGVQEAKRGNKIKARELLSELIELDPDQELAWLWLALISSHTDEVRQCLEQVIVINPDNEQAKNWLAKYASDDSQPSDSITEIAEDSIDEGRESEELWTCPLCQSPAVMPYERCPKCQALLTLDDLDALLDNEGADFSLMHPVIEHYESLPLDNVDFTVHYQLGLAYLNIKRIAQGIARLRAAYELQPDEVLKSQVDELVARYREIQRHSRNEVKPAVTNTSELPESSVLIRKDSVASGEQRVVLIVDDSEAVQKLIATTLECEGYRVVSASHGLEALTRLTEIIPDLILLDIAMPHLDGYQLCKLIKGNDVTKDVPVVMLSGKDGVFERMRGKLVGAVDYVAKPFEPDTLLETVGHYCRHRE